MSNKGKKLIIIISSINIKKVFTENLLDQTI